MTLPTITMPEFKTDLPSDSKITATYTPMTIRDEKVLLIAKESGEQNDILNAIINIVDRCTSQINIKTRPMCDLEWLFLKIRSNSVSNIAELTYTEDGVEKPHEFKVDLNSVKIKKAKKVSSTIKINSDVSIELRWPPIETYLTKEYKTAEESKQFDVILLSSIVKIIDGDSIIETKNADTEELQEWISSLPVKTYTNIQTFLESIPTLHHELKYKDTDGKEQKIVLSTLTDFFTF